MSRNLWIPRLLNVTGIREKANNSRPSYYCAPWNDIFCFVAIEWDSAFVGFRGRLLVFCFFFLQLFLSRKCYWSVWTRGIDVLFREEGMQLLNPREKKKAKEWSSNSQNVFFVLHSFSGIIEVEVIFLFFFLFIFRGGKIAKLWVGWIKGGLGGERQDSSCWEKKERKREKMQRKREREKERHPDKEALELIERGYKCEHKSLTPKKTLCVTAREGYVRKQDKVVVVVKVFFFLFFFGRVDGGLEGMEGGETHRPLCWSRKGGAKKGKGS